jgi:hypothetical protein
MIGDTWKTSFKCKVNIKTDVERSAGWTWAGLFCLRIGTGGMLL